MQPSDSPKQYFPALTGLRAVAAFLVYAHHASPTVPFGTDFFRVLFQEAHIGVSIFFVLSGFLIALRYSRTFERGKAIPWRSYALHRLARIYPVYVICTIVALIFRQDFRISSWVINLFMAQGLFSEFSFTGIGVGWSMTVEVFFYAAAPLVLLYWEKWGLLKWLFATLLAGCVLLVLGQLLSFPFGFLPDWNFLLRSTFFGRCFEFYLGIWLAKKYLLTPGPLFPSLKGTSGVLTYGGAVGILAVMFCMASVQGVPPTPPSTLQLVAFNGLNNYLLPLCIGSLLIGLVQENTLVSQGLRSRVGEELGKGSYLFYLVHYTFGFDILYFHVWQNRGGVLLLLALASVAGYYAVEAPLRRKLLKIASPFLYRETKSQ